MKYYIGIDLGGTNIAAGVVDSEFKILAKASTPTARPRPCRDICADMAKVSLEAVETAGLKIDDIESVGVGSPGTVNSDTGIIEYANNLDFYNEPVAEYIKEHIRKPVYLENDANAAAYGEFIAGSDRIYSGFNFAGAEIGHMVIEVDGPVCTCGRRGCFEVYSSATGLIRMTK